MTTSKGAYICEFLISSLCRTITFGTERKALEIGSLGSRKANARRNVAFPTLRRFLTSYALIFCTPSRLTANLLRRSASSRQAVILTEQALVLRLHGFVAFAGRIPQSLKVGDPDLTSCVLDDSSLL